MLVTWSLWCGLFITAHALIITKFRLPAVQIAYQNFHQIRRYSNQENQYSESGKRQKNSPKKDAIADSKDVFSSSPLGAGAYTTIGQGSAKSKREFEFETSSHKEAPMIISRVISGLAQDIADRTAPLDAKSTVEQMTQLAGKKFLQLFCTALH